MPNLVIVKVYSSFHASQNGASNPYNTISYIVSSLSSTQTGGKDVVFNDNSVDIL